MCELTILRIEKYLQKIICLIQKFEHMALRLEGLHGLQEMRVQIHLRSNFLHTSLKYIIFFFYFYSFQHTKNTKHY